MCSYPKQFGRAQNNSDSSKKSFGPIKEQAKKKILIHFLVYEDSHM